MVLRSRMAGKTVHRRKTTSADSWTDRPQGDAQDQLETLLERAAAATVSFPPRVPTDRRGHATPGVRSPLERSAELEAAHRLRCLASPRSTRRPLTRNRSLGSHRGAIAASVEMVPRV
jgi:hypothetical protein